MRVMTGNQRVNEVAYQLWLDEGCPDGRSLDHWLRAKELCQPHGEDDPAEPLRRAAYTIWEEEGCPAGLEIDHWLRAEERHQAEREHVNGGKVGTKQPARRSSKSAAGSGA